MNQPALVPTSTILLPFLEPPKLATMLPTLAKFAMLKFSMLELSTMAIAIGTHIWRMMMNTMR